jgi:sugar phosphate isomerase/epimerase
MPLGINLSFAVKRWITPESWSRVVRDRLGLDLVQFSFDLADPMWPDAVLAGHAARIRSACADQGLTVHSAFIGLAHYTFNQLLHPDTAVRDYAEAWLGRAYRFAADAGMPRVGGPLGAVAAGTDGKSVDAITDADYADLVKRLRRLGGVAREAGLLELYIEPTPLKRECPWTIAQAQRLAADLAGSPVPWRWCIDWGHATIEPLYGAGFARVDAWLEQLAPAIGALHLQQTDGRYDRHWDFTHDGIVEPEAAAALVRRTGLADRPIFLEVFYPFEETDAVVLDGVRQSITRLKPAFAPV